MADLPAGGGIAVGFVGGPSERAARAWKRAEHAESRAMRDPNGGLALHWVAHAWRRCASACEHAAAAVPDTASGPAGDVAAAWEALASSWEAAAAAWLAVATAQRHLDAARLDEDRPFGPMPGAPSPGPDDPVGPRDPVTAHVAAVVTARRHADDLVRDAERHEASAWS